MLLSVEESFFKIHKREKGERLNTTLAIAVFIFPALIHFATGIIPLMKHEQSFWVIDIRERTFLNN
jgi:hypothetical protein